MKHNSLTLTIIVPRMRTGIKYILTELEEKIRQQILRLKVFQSYTNEMHKTMTKNIFNTENKLLNINNKNLLPESHKYIIQCKSSKIDNQEIYLLIKYENDHYCTVKEATLKILKLKSLLESNRPKSKTALQSYEYCMIKDKTGCLQKCNLFLSISFEKLVSKVLLLTVSEMFNTILNHNIEKKTHFDNKRNNKSVLDIWTKAQPEIFLNKKKNLTQQSMNLFNNKSHSNLKMGRRYSTRDITPFKFCTNMNCITVYYVNVFHSENENDDPPCSLCVTESEMSVIDFVLHVAPSKEIESNSPKPPCVTCSEPEPVPKNNNIIGNKEIIRTIKRKNPDGTDVEEKQIITIKTEKIQPKNVMATKSETASCCILPKQEQKRPCISAPSSNRSIQVKLTFKHSPKLQDYTQPIPSTYSDQNKINKKHYCPCCGNIKEFQSQPCSVCAGNSEKLNTEKIDPKVNQKSKNKKSIKNCWGLFRRGNKKNQEKCPSCSSATPNTCDCKTNTCECSKDKKTDNQCPFCSKTAELLQNENKEVITVVKQVKKDGTVVEKTVSVKTEKIPDNDSETNVCCKMNKETEPKVTTSKCCQKPSNPKPKDSTCNCSKAQDKSSKKKNIDANTSTVDLEVTFKPTSAQLLCPSQASSEKSQSAENPRYVIKILTEPQNTSSSKSVCRICDSDREKYVTTKEDKSKECEICEASLKKKSGTEHVCAKCNETKKAKTQSKSDCPMCAAHFQDTSENGAEQIVCKHCIKKLKMLVNSCPTCPKHQAPKKVCSMCELLESLSQSNSWTKQKKCSKCKRKKEEIGCPSCKELQKKSKSKAKTDEMCSSCGNILKSASEISQKKSHTKSHCEKKNINESETGSDRKLCKHCVESFKSMKENIEKCSLCSTGPPLRSTCKCSKHAKKIRSESLCAYPPKSQTQDENICAKCKEQKLKDEEEKHQYKTSKNKHKNKKKSNSKLVTELCSACGHELETDKKLSDSSDTEKEEMCVHCDEQNALCKHCSVLSIKSNKTENEKICSAHSQKSATMSQKISDNCDLEKSKKDKSKRPLSLENIKDKDSNNSCPSYKYDEKISKNDKKLESKSCCSRATETGKKKDDKICHGCPSCEGKQSQITAKRNSENNICFKCKQSSGKDKIIDKASNSKYLSYKDGEKESEKDNKSEDKKCSSCGQKILKPSKSAKCITCNYRTISAQPCKSCRGSLEKPSELPKTADKRGYNNSHICPSCAAKQSQLAAKQKSQKNICSICQQSSQKDKKDDSVDSCHVCEIKASDQSSIESKSTCPICNKKSKSKNKSDERCIICQEHNMKSKITCTICGLLSEPKSNNKTASCPICNKLTRGKVTTPELCTHCLKANKSEGFCCPTCEAQKAKKPTETCKVCKSLKDTKTKSRKKHGSKHSKHSGIQAKAEKGTDNEIHIQISFDPVLLKKISGKHSTSGKSSEISCCSLSNKSFGGSMTGYPSCSSYQKAEEDFDGEKSCCTQTVKKPSSKSCCASNKGKNDSKYDCTTKDVGVNTKTADRYDVRSVGMMKRGTSQTIRRCPPPQQPACACKSTPNICMGRQVHPRRVKSFNERDCTNYNYFCV